VAVVILHVQKYGEKK